VDYEHGGTFYFEFLSSWLSFKNFPLGSTIKIELWPKKKPQEEELLLLFRSI
jgi:hypothetical protein